ncbi:hypothetical protein QTJ16_004473 [Diplocarpon rosae]|uniref:Zn(2)-C6 fungal-type domain-containing protein n=1 Tax=Diplocarpon rosae TaxID=946125 RepID=A0AAD9SYR6_9HELO|nr:hypothetical protein QTJ16_004473 [Diplocarpon rosae]
MSGYQQQAGSYPHHPHSHHPQNLQPHHIPSPSSAGSGHNDLSQHHAHGLPLQQQTYQPYEPAQMNVNSPYNNHNGHGEMQQSPVQLPVQAPSGSGSGSGLGGAGDGVKGNRLRKACDSCSIRKVKCDESGPPCRACAALEIPCTFERPSRRRGPPNRHAEAIKKKSRMESPMGSFSSPTSPHNVAATLATFASNPTLSAEAICPISTLELLVDDFFTYIHPLCPFPHEPSFRAAFRAREDVKNPSFLALLASMVGVLVASFPRKPRLHLKAQHREHLFPNSMSLVERCHKVAVAARGPGYLDNELSVYDAATSYFLGLAAAYTFQWKQTRLYFGETLNIIRVLGAHKVQDNGLSVGDMPGVFGAENSNFEHLSTGVDYIRQEIGRRVFWVMFVGIVSIQQLGATFGELHIPPPTANNPYPPLPMEVDDEYIHAGSIDKQPEGTISKLVGFNINVKIFRTVTPLSTMELAYGINEVFDWNRQKNILEECLREVKRVLENIPRELQLQSGSEPGESGQSSLYVPPNFDMSGLRVNGADPSQYPYVSEERRRLQFEIQKANIYASQLGTRSSFVDKYWNLEEAYNSMKTKSEMGSPALSSVGLDGATSHSDSGVAARVAIEREMIIKDLLEVLGCISQVNMEPNGGSFINKIRQIASTLIDTPNKHKGPLALKSEEYLSRFLDVLMKLERISPACRSENGDGLGFVDEEEELRNWADLREYQMRFVQAGGFMSGG